jgi:hypothetical protein|nr:MAG TPA: hypothetical protein [Caudoviricetes sp.]
MKTPDFNKLDQSLKNLSQWIHKLTIIKVEEFNQIMQSAPATLQRNQASVSACNQAGQTLLDTIEAEGGIGSDELDAKVSEYLAKTKITVENMNKRRKPLTQLLATVSKSFTSLESAIDVKSVTTIPYKLQQARNKYAAKKIAEQKRREEEARRKQMLENEKAQYRSDISVMLDTAYAAYVEKHINALNSMFNRATLATYNDVCRRISETSINFSWSAFVENVSDNKQTFYMDAETRKAIKNEVAIQKKKDFTERYRFEIEGTKQDLIDKLPSLRKQLEEQEELRRTNAAEAARIEEERKQQEAEERKKQEEERKRREEEAKAKAAAEKSAAEVQAAFDFSAASMSPTPTKAKVKKKIQITNPQGFMQVYQIWFMREGINMSMEDLEKVHKKMITYCEKVVNKDGEQIQSAYVKYIDDVTAK